MKKFMVAITLSLLTFGAVHAEDVKHSLKGLSMECLSEGINVLCSVDVKYLRCDTNQLISEQQKNVRYNYSVYFTPGDRYVNFTVVDKKLSTITRASAAFTTLYPATGERHAGIDLSDASGNNTIDCRVFKSTL